jgi:hypothetical protein
MAMLIDKTKVTKPITIASTTEFLLALLALHLIKCDPEVQAMLDSAIDSYLGRAIS